MNIYTLYLGTGQSEVLNMHFALIKALMKHFFDATSQKQYPTLDAMLGLMYHIELGPYYTYVFNSEHL